MEKPSAVIVRRYIFELSRVIAIAAMQKVLVFNRRKLDLASRKFRDFADEL